MQHEELIDHKHDVSARKLSANFEAAVSKALCKEDELTLVIWHQQKKRLLKTKPFCLSRSDKGSVTGELKGLFTYMVLAETVSKLYLLVTAVK